MTGMSTNFKLQFRKIGIDNWSERDLSEQLQVGSGIENTLILTDGDLSDSHFEIRQTPTGIYLVDTDTLTGVTFLNEQVLPSDAPVLIDVMDVFIAGNYEFRLVLGLPVDPVISHDADNLAGEDRVKPAVNKVFPTINRRSILLAGLFALIASVIGGVLIFYFFLHSPQEGEAMRTEMPTAMAGTQQTLPTHTPTSTAEFSISVTPLLATMEANIAAPGAGNVNLENFSIESSGLSIGQLGQLNLSPQSAMNLAIKLYAENVAYVYAFSGIVENGKVLATRMEYLRSDSEELVSGVLAPVWNEKPEMTFDVEFTAVVNRIEDGKSNPIVLLMPEQYGYSDQDMIYVVHGIYSIAGSQTRYDAFMRFRADGSLLDVTTYGELGEDRVTAYRVNPAEGDTFIIFRKEFRFDPAKAEDFIPDIPSSIVPPSLQSIFMNALKDQIGFEFGAGEFLLSEGEKLVFGKTPFRWYQESYDGKMAAGLALQDLDGTLFAGYVPVDILP